MNLRSIVYRNQSAVRIIEPQVTSFRFTATIFFFIAVNFFVVIYLFLLFFLEKLDFKWMFCKT